MLTIFAIAMYLLLAMAYCTFDIFFDVHIPKWIRIGTCDHLFSDRFRWRVLLSLEYHHVSSKTNDPKQQLHGLETSSWKGRRAFRDDKTVPLLEAMQEGEIGESGLSS